MPIMRKSITFAIGALGCASAALPTWSQTRSDLWTRSTLSGDWGGLRPVLERHGLTFSLDYTSEISSNLRGGIRTGTVVNGLFQPQLDVDLEKLAAWNGARIRVSGIITHGPGLTPEYVGNLMPISSIEAGPVARLFEVWIEQNTFNDRFSVRAGLMIADTEFSNSETASTFLNNTFGWNALFGSNLPAGGPSYPIPAPGLRARVKPVEDVYVQAAVFSGDPSGRDGSNQSAPLPTGTVFSFSGGAFLIAEAGYTPNQGKDARGLPAAYKAGAWYHTSSRFGDQRFDNTGLSLADPMSTGIPTDHTGNWALYGVVDQMLYRVPGTEAQGLSGFARLTGGPSDRNLVNFYVDGGLVYTGLIPGRPDDKIGIAAAHARISDSVRALDRDVASFTGAFFPVRSADATIEATYRAVLAPWWTMQADLQYIIRPSGGVLNDDGSFRQNAWVIGGRSVLRF